MPEPTSEVRGGRLSIVATPIGNLEDITLRALRVLREADTILAEDTRRTRNLCRHYEITTLVRSFHAHSGEGKVEALVAQLLEGSHLALVTDAGTPLVSDPGARLVRAAADAGVVVEPIPGASAALAALSVAALPVDQFRFVGFLARRGRARREALRTIAESTEASVLFEAPGRLPQTLADLAEAAGQAREAAVCRELTKLHEEVVRGPLSNLTEAFAEAPKGEVTLVVAGASIPDEDRGLEGLEPRARALLSTGASPRDVARQLASELGAPRREVYQRILDLCK